MPSIRDRLLGAGRSLARRGVDTALRFWGSSVLPPDYAEPYQEAFPIPSGRYGRETHPWPKATPETINTAIVRSFYGETQTLQDIYDDVMDRDERVSSCVRTRALALVGRPWTVKAPPGFENDAGAKRNAERCTSVIAALEEWPLVVGKLCEGISRGYAVAENMWGWNRQGWRVPREIRWRHPRRIAFDDTMRPCRYDATDTFPGIPLDELKPDGFIFHAPTSGRPTYAPRGGVLLPCLGPSYGKKLGFKWWLKGAERYGVPLPVMKLPEANENLEAKGRELLRRMHADWSIVTWGDIDIQKVAGTGEFTADVHQRLVDNSNTAIAIAILGQNLTTEVQGGSFAAANAHNFVRGDLLAGDAIELGVTVRRHLLEPLCRVNGWTNDGPVPIYEVQLATKAQRELYEYHLRYGLLTKDEARDVGLSLPPVTDGTGGEYVLDPSLQAGAGAGGAPPGGAGADDPFVLAMAREIRARGHLRIPPGWTPPTTTTPPTRTSATSSTGAPRTPTGRTVPS